MRKKPSRPVLVTAVAALAIAVLLVLVELWGYYIFLGCKEGVQFGSVQELGITVQDCTTGQRVELTEPVDRQRLLWELSQVTYGGLSLRESPVTQADGSYSVAVYGREGAVWLVVTKGGSFFLAGDSRLTLRNSQGLYPCLRQLMEGAGEPVVCLVDARTPVQVR